MKKKWPVLNTDEEAERFVAEADLTEYDFGEGVPMHFEIERKSERVNMRMPKPLLDAVKRRAQKRGIPYTRFIRELLEREIARPDEPRR
jgi:predicted DNA binding CopG/RHH family protein